MSEETIEIPSVLKPRFEGGQLKADIQTLTFKKAKPEDVGERQTLQLISAMRNDGPRIFNTVATITFIGGKVLDVKYEESEIPQC